MSKHLRSYTNLPKIKLSYTLMQTNSVAGCHQLPAVWMTNLKIHTQIGSSVNETFKL